MKPCPHCQYDMRSNKLNRHIGLIHGDKATKKQANVARKARRDKWCVCERCGASIQKKSKVRHLRVCDGAVKYVATRDKGWRIVVPRGPKQRPLP